MIWKPVWETLMPTTSISEKWVDIVSPDVPVHTAAPFTLGLAVAGVFALLILCVYFYRRPRLRAKRALRRLARDLQHSQIKTKPACVQIQQSMRKGLGQHQLLSVQWCDDHHSAWLAYVQWLSKCCFSAPSPSKAELDSLIQEGLLWLNRKTVDR